MIGNAIGNVAPDAELVEVIILPTQGDLKDPVQAVEADGERHLDAPANRGLHLVERDCKPSNLVGTGYAARLAEGRDKFQGKRSAIRLIGCSASRPSMSRR